MLKSAAAANDASARLPTRLTSDDAVGISVPDGHIGPVLLSGTGRTVWWTGRVAIGLRYKPVRCEEPLGQHALWLQGVLLDGRHAAKCA